MSLPFQKELENWLECFDKIDPLSNLPFATKLELEKQCCIYDSDQLAMKMFTDPQQFQAAISPLLSPPGNGLASTQQGRGAASVLRPKRYQRLNRLRKEAEAPNLVAHQQPLSTSSLGGVGGGEEYIPTSPTNASDNLTENNLSDQLISLKTRLERSVLKTLNEGKRPGCRSEVPTKRRPEINFLVNKEPKIHSVRESLTNLDTVISVTFYHPQKPVFRAQEVEVLASQPLSRVLELFDCAMGDYYFPKPKLPEPEETATNTDEDSVLNPPMEDNAEKEDWKPPEHYTMLVIEDCVFVDLNENKLTMEEYKRFFHEWINKHSPLHLGEFDQFKIIPYDAYNFDQVGFKMGKRYTLVHGQECEHTFCFTDMQYNLSLFSPNDVNNHSLVSMLTDREKEDYPRSTFRSRISRQKCRMCAYYPAEYVTIDDIHAGESPSFFCTYCFEPFHFDTEGKPLWSFRYFPYKNRRNSQRLTRSSRRSSISKT